MDQVFPLADRQGSSSKAPLVSVVMPAYNVEQYIAESIESILSQTCDDFEFIIINDGSSDATLDIIEKYARQDVRIIRRSTDQNFGINHARNMGLTHVRGTYIAMMDADDIAVPQRLEKQVRFLESHPEVGVVGGAMVIVNEHNILIGERRYPIDDAAIRKRMFYFNPFCHPSTMMRKGVLEQSGMYNLQYRGTADYDLYFRIGMISQFANLDELVHRYRVRPGSLSFVQKKMMEIETISIRKVYFKAYGASVSDRIYNFLHFLSLFVIPSQWKYWIFLKLRESIV
ncbi:MAG: glycosyltransferase [Candidatus Peribacteraceae bacterium]|nr:glycosyltransferase [Candidatus Peribacteraceae bacterium]